MGTVDPHPTFSTGHLRLRISTHRDLPWAEPVLRWNHFGKPADSHGRDMADDRTPRYQFTRLPEGDSNQRAFAQRLRTVLPRSLPDGKIVCDEAPAPGCRIMNRNGQV